MAILLIVILLIIVAACRRQRKKKAARQYEYYEKASKHVGISQAVKRALIFVAIVIVLGMFFSSGKTKDADVPGYSSATSTPRVTSAPKPTATPEPTATPVPDYAGMTAEKAVQTLAEYYSNPTIAFESVMEINGLVNVQAKITNNIWNEKMAVQGICQYVLNIAEHAFDHSAINSLVFYFDAELRDTYGNLNTSRVVNINIGRTTAEKINYEWMLDRVYVSTKEVLTAFDDYNVHASLIDGLN